MAKKLQKGQIKAIIAKFVATLKRNWDKPNEGEFLTIKEITAYGVGQVGNFIFSTVIGLMVFSAGWFCGAIMGIKQMDFYTIGVLGSLVSYVLIFMNPLGVLIYENHGILEKKTKIFAIICYSAQIIVGIGCYLLPTNLFERLPAIGMVALPQVLGNILVCGGVSSFLNWFVRLKFCAKHGRFKPFLMLYGIPSVIIMSIIPFLPLQEADYAVKIIVLHFAFTLMNIFLGGYGSVGNLVPFMTPNSNERQRLLSIVPIITSLTPSIITMFFPMLIQQTGGYDSILTYKIFVPIFGIIGVAVGFVAIKCKERVIEKPNYEDRPKVTFWKGAKKVLKNKYLWITNIQNVVYLWSAAYGGILQTWIIYSLRMEWFWGIASNIVVLSMTIGNLLTPLLIKKFQKKNILIWSRVISIGTILLMFLSIKTSSIVLFMFAMFLKNGIMPIETGVNSGLGPDIMDYHQCRFGERCDSMSGVFTWFLAPITMLLGYISPFLMKSIGFTSDWDIQFNTSVLDKQFYINIILSIISLALSIIPFFFYDLTREKHDQCIKELQERAGLLDESGATVNDGGDDPDGGGGDEGDFAVNADSTGNNDNFVGSEV